MEKEKESKKQNIELIGQAERKYKEAKVENSKKERNRQKDKQTKNCKICGKLNKK